MPQNAFKVIIVGGGPVGLMVANYLEQAQIDFAILEQRPNVVMELGASVGVSTISRNSFYKLGMGDALDEASTTIAHYIRFNRSEQDNVTVGKKEWYMDRAEVYCFSTSLAKVYADLLCSIGLQIMTRHDLTRVLYNNLSTESKTKIYCNKKIDSIDLSSNGVEVSCLDGTSYSGSIVIGADGAYSKVRHIMRKLALEAGSNKVNAQTPFPSNYRCFWVRVPLDSRLLTGGFYESQGRDVVSQTFVGTDAAAVAIYEHLNTSAPTSARYTVADEEAFVKRWGQLPLLPSNEPKWGLTVQEAYASRIAAGFVGLEEGVLDFWSWQGRIVLVGDAAHKLTPYTGVGYNLGVADIVALMDSLQTAVHDSQALHDGSSGLPNSEQLALAFKTYQEARSEIVKAECLRCIKMTARATRRIPISRL